MNKSPKAYYDRYILKKDEPPTPQMILGTQVHCAVLEPEKFASSYFVLPKVDRRTTKGKEEIAEFLKGLPVGSQTIAAEDMELIKAIQNAVLSNRVASDLLKEGIAERSGYLTDPNTGLNLKIRPDWVTLDNMIIDLKTCRDASKNRFQNAIYDFGYHIQAAFYADCFATIAGIEADKTPFIFIAVENTAPFSVAVYPAARRMITEGRSIYKEALFKYMDCQANNKWPDINNDLAVEIDLPYWVYTKKEYNQ